MTGRLSAARAFHPLVVSDLRPLTEDSRAITLAIPDALAAAYRFSAGQHLTFAHPTPDGEVRRTFSICTAPGSGELTVGVKLLPDGVFSGHVRDRLRIGDTLQVLTPAGRFGTRSPADGRRTSVGIVAGSGVTPVLSVMADLLGTQPRARFVLVYGNRSASSVMFADELADLKDRWLDRLEIHHVLSGEAPGIPLATGRIEEATLRAVLAQHPPDTVRDWYLCGPLGLVQSSEQLLLSVGVNRARVHHEVFFTGQPLSRPAPRSGGSDHRTVTVRLNGRTTTVAMAGHGSILDAVLTHRPDAPYACRGGVCGTCRVRLLEGAVEMAQNYALDPVDTDSGFRLACQSTPLTSHVALDFDA